MAETEETNETAPLDHQTGFGAEHLQMTLVIVQAFCTTCCCCFDEACWTIAHNWFYTSSWQRCQSLVSLSSTISNCWLLTSISLLGVTARMNPLRHASGCPCCWSCWWCKTPCCCKSTFAQDFLHCHVGGWLAIPCSNLNSPLPVAAGEGCWEACQCGYILAEIWTAAAWAWAWTRAWAWTFGNGGTWALELGW